MAGHHTSHPRHPPTRGAVGVLCWASAQSYAGSPCGTVATGHPVPNLWGACCNMGRRPLRVPCYPPPGFVALVRMDGKPRPASLIAQGLPIAHKLSPGISSHGPRGSRPVGAPCKVCTFQTLPPSLRYVLGGVGTFPLLLANVSGFPRFPPPSVWGGVPCGLALVPGLIGGSYFDSLTPARLAQWSRRHSVGVHLSMPRGAGPVPRWERSQGKYETTFTNHQTKYEKKSPPNHRRVVTN